MISLANDKQYYTIGTKQNTKMQATDSSSYWHIWQEFRDNTIFIDVRYII